MTLRFRNTLGGALEEFVPLDPALVRIYSCGPTVYAPAHVGNFRSFLFADLLRRYLAWHGYPVKWVMNITDVDDKIIRDAVRQGMPIGDGGEGSARLAPRPKGAAAYRPDAGPIFSRIASWPAYGRLARLDPSQL